MPLTNRWTSGWGSCSAVLRGVGSLLLVSACHDVPSAAEAVADVQSVRIQGEGLQLRTGEFQRLVAEAVDGAGIPVAVAVKWRSGDVRIATVDSLGLVTAIGAGETTIRATVGALEARTTLRARHAALWLVGPSVDDAEVGRLLDFRAEFRDVAGRQVAAGDVRSIQWTVSPPGSVGFVEVAEWDDMQVRLRLLKPGPVRLEVSAAGLSAERSWMTLADVGEPAATIGRFTLRQGPSGIGWLYVPDLFVRGGHAGVAVTRIDFHTPSWTKSVCGRAVLQGGIDEPLFDFQPYNFSWVGTPVAHGAQVLLTIWVERNGRSEAITSLGVVETADVSKVIDYNSAGFLWSAC